jgi:hypothetical protein
MMKSRLALILSSAAMVGSALVVAAPASSASAAPARSEAASIAIAAAVPSCVKRTVSSNNRSVTLKNNCGIPVRVNVTFTRSPDSGCYTLWADDKKSHSRPWPAKYSGVKSCGSWP